MKRRVWRALRTWPDASGWARIAIEAAWLLPLLVALGFLGGLMNWQPRFDPQIARLALVAVVVPALGEELLFRAALLPEPRSGKPALAAVLLSTALFVLWHPPQGLIFGPHWAAVMFNPWFLACVAAVGIACARVYFATGSIWPSVLLHWLVVVGWKVLLGGPSPWVAP